MTSLAELSVTIGLSAELRNVRNAGLLARAGLAVRNLSDILSTATAIDKFLKDDIIPLDEEKVKVKPKIDSIPPPSSVPPSGNKKPKNKAPNNKKKPKNDNKQNSGRKKRNKDMEDNNDQSQLQKKRYPENRAPEGANRNSAFREAKRDNNIPMNQRPYKIGPNKDKRGNPQPGKVYYFKDSHGKDVKIRDDSMGHIFEDGYELGPHFNVGDKHYNYNKELKELNNIKKNK